MDSLGGFGCLSSRAFTALVKVSAADCLAAIELSFSSFSILLSKTLTFSIVDALFFS